MTTVWYSDGPDSPRISPREAIALAGIEDSGQRDITVTVGWTFEDHAWFADANARFQTVLAGYGLAKRTNDGTITAPPTRISAVPLTIMACPPDVAVISAVARGNGFAFATNVGWADVLAANAKRVVLEINRNLADIGTPLIEGNVVAIIERAQSDLKAAISRPADEIDLAIGANVVALFPKVPTLQFGPGGIGEGIVRAIDRPVAVWSGLATDAMADLHTRGLLTRPLTAAYCHGGKPIHELHKAEMLELRSVTVVHDVATIAQIPQFVGCNTALQVGLDGSINIERVGHRIVAGIGGHADFCLGASRSPGGLSVIAVRSTAANGESTIVSRVDVVSTQRSDIQIVVTEHGVADLRAASEAERSKRLIAIAAPQYREMLRKNFGTAS